MENECVSSSNVSVFKGGYFNKKVKKIIILKFILKIMVILKKKSRNIALANQKSTKLF